MTSHEIDSDTGEVQRRANLGPTLSRVALGFLSVIALMLVVPPSVRLSALGITSLVAVILAAISKRLRVVALGALLTSAAIFTVAAWLAFNVAYG